MESTDLQSWTGSAEEVGEEKQNKYITSEKSFSFILQHHHSNQRTRSEEKARAEKAKVRLLTFGQKAEKSLCRIEMRIWWFLTNCGKGKCPIINRNVPQFMHWKGECHEIYWRDYFCGCIPTCVCTPAGTQLGGCRHWGSSGIGEWPFFHLGCTRHENWKPQQIFLGDANRVSQSAPLPFCTCLLYHGMSAKLWGERGSAAVP